MLVNALLVMLGELWGGSEESNGLVEMGCEEGKADVQKGAQQKQVSDPWALRESRVSD